MKTILLTFLFLFLSPEILFLVGAQPGSGGGSSPSGNLYPYTRVSPFLAIIIAGIATSLFFVVIFTIYLRHRSVSYGVSPTMPRRSVAVISSGLDQSVLETFPTFSYSEVKDHQIGKGVLECAVCLSEFEGDEKLRFIPKCDHVFHLECIDAWLGLHVTCPVCRADLVPKPGDNQPVLIPPVDSCENSQEIVNYIVERERSRSRNDQFVMQIDEENQHQNRGMGMNRNLSFQYPKRKPQRLWSFQKFRSFSTGHLLVQPGEDMNRFTLRLPDVVRKEVIDRALLNRSSSIAIVIEDGGEGSTNRNIKKSDREVKSDRWDFFTRALSMKLRSPRGVVRKIEESSGST